MRGWNGEDRWFPAIVVLIVAVTVMAGIGFASFKALLGASNDDSHHHPITVIERKVDRIKAKQSAQIAADRRTLHQLTRAMELLP